MASYLQNRIKYKMIRTSFPEIFCKKVLLMISQNSQETTCVGVSFLLKLQACNFIEKDSGTGVFLYILKSSSEQVFIERLRWLHLNVIIHE